MTLLGFSVNRGKRGTSVIGPLLGGGLGARSKLKDRMASGLVDEIIQGGIWCHIQGASKDQSAHRRRQARPQHFLEHGPGCLWGQLHGGNRLPATAASKDTFARCAEIAHPVGAGSAVGGNQPATIIAFQEVYRGRTGLSSSATAHSEQDHRAHRNTCP